MLSSIVIHHLQKMFEEKFPVIYLFLDEADAKTYSLADLFGSLLKQMIQLKSFNEVSTELLGLYRRSTAGADKKWNDIFKCLEREILLHDRVYIIVDAMDVCPSSVRKELERELYQLQRNWPDQVSLMLTARESVEQRYSITCNNCKTPNLLIYYSCSACKPNFDLCQKCKNNGTECTNESHTIEERYKVMEIEIRPEEKYLKRYIHRRIGDELEDTQSRDKTGDTELDVEIGDAEPEPWDDRKTPNRSNASPFVQICREDPSIPHEIISTVTKKAKRNILIAKMYVDELTRSNNRWEIDKALETFPTELNLIYEHNMQRIQNSEEHDLALKVMARITSARRELTLEELQHVLATDPGDRDFNEKKRYKKDLILRITDGLVGISKSDISAAVHGLHFSLYAYLDDTREKWFPNAEVDMANACLNYLNYDEFSKPCQDVRQDLREFNSRMMKYPFIKYASHYFGDHVRNATHDPDVQKSILRLLNKPRRVAAVVQAAGLTKSWSADVWDAYEGVEAIHLCAWFGLQFAMSALVEKKGKQQIDAREKRHGQTPLMYACRRGHVEAVRYLLDQGADINAVSARGSTPMFEAVLHNNKEVVDLLVEQDALKINAVHTKERDRTALMLAASRGGSELISSLLEHAYIEINKQDSAGYTALCLAAQSGFGDSVRELVESEADGFDINVTNKSGYSALFLAAMNGDCEMVKLLLRNGADPSLRDTVNGTALLRAVDFGQIDVVELLLNDERTEYEDLKNDGCDLLISASRHGFAKIITLLHIKGVDLDGRDRTGQTALHYASLEGKLDVVQDLLALGANPAIEDNNGRTPLAIARQSGQPLVASVLKGEIIDQEIDPSLMLDAGVTPIWLLAKMGRSDIVKQAITAGRSDIDEKEPGTDRTAIHFAAVEDHVETLRLLLENTNLSPSPLDAYKRTPLHLAALNGRLKVAELLLSRDPDVDCKDQWGCTPLYLTRLEENQTPDRFLIAAALVEAGANTKFANIQKTLFAALQSGKRVAVKILLEAGADVLAPDETGQRAINVTEDESMLRTLRTSKTFRLDVESGGSNNGGQRKRALSNAGVGEAAKRTRSVP